MKKITILFLIASILLPIEAVAQKEKPNSNIGISLEGGFSHLFLGKNLSPVGYAKPWLGGGGGAALYYELQYKHFLFRTGFGVDYMVNNNRLNVPDYTATIAEYPGMKYHYTFNKYSETTHYGVGYVPVMLGGNFDRIFFLVGAKIGVVSFGGSTTPKTDVTIWATDDDVIDPMTGLYTHQMTDYSFTGQKTPIAFNNLNIMGSFEIGLNLDSRLWKASKEDDGKPKSLKDRRKAQQKAKRKPVNKGAYYKKLREKKPFKDCLHYRLSLFADYGISNLLPSNLPTGDLMTFNNVSDITPHSIYHYSAHQNAVLNNLLVGVKLAIQYEIPHKAPKKGDMAVPYIVTFVSDERTGKPLPGTSVSTQAVTNSKKPKKPVVKTTDSKYGRVAKAYPPGEYIISASHAGYFPQEPFHFQHEDQYDTLRLALYPQQILKSRTVDAKTGRPISANVIIYDEKGDTVLQTHVDSLSNQLSTPLDDRKQYHACASAEGYLDTCMLITDLRDHTIALEPKVVVRFLLKNMFFATDKTNILSSSKPALQELYELLSGHPELRIKIIGHTDDVGKEDYNQRLSEGRAASVKKEMVKRGISSDRMETEGHGETDPIVPNDSDEHRQMNRRVEIVILNSAR